MAFVLNRLADWLLAELRATEGDLGVVVQVAAERADQLAQHYDHDGPHELPDWRALAQMRNEAAQLRRRAEDAEAKVRAVELVRCWRNEDDKQFVFADDLWVALGVGAATGTKGDPTDV